MLQRIQTLYLLAVMILTGLNIFFPINYFTGGEVVYTLTISGLEKISAQNGVEVVERAWTLSIILLVIPLITLLTINLYKRRMLQIRLTIFNSLLMIGYYGLFFYFRYYFAEKYAAEPTFEWTITLPLICIILNYLAIRSIGKDEALVKSLERLR